MAPLFGIAKDHGLTIRIMTHSSNIPALKRLAAALATSLAFAIAMPVAAQDTAAAPALQSVAQSDIEGLMSYVLKARAMTADQLVLEMRDLRQRHEAGHDVSTLKLALVLADQPDAQESEITSLLQPLFEESRGTKPELRAYALLVARDMQDRKRMKETIASTQNRLRESQRSQEASEAKAAQMRRQIDELQNKINAFMMMEQSILKRGR